MAQEKKKQNKTKIPLLVAFGLIVCQTKNVNMGVYIDTMGVYIYTMGVYIYICNNQQHKFIYINSSHGPTAIHNSKLGFLSSHVHLQRYEHGEQQKNVKENSVQTLFRVKIPVMLKKG